MPIRRVDPSSPAAYPTITQALSSAASGDVILVAGGSYRESPVVRLSVSIRPQNQEQPLVLIGSIGVEGTAADLRLTGCTIQESVGSGLTVSEGAKATLGNCTLTNNRKYGIEVQAGGTLEARQCSVGGNLDAGVVAAGVVRLADCVVSNNQSSGAAVSPGGELSVSGGAIHGNAGNGVWVNPQSVATIEHCEVHHNKGALGGKGNLEILNCKLHDGEVGIYLFEGGTGTISDSEIWGNAAVGIQTGPSATADVSRCRIHDNGQCSVYLSGDENAAIDNARVTIEDCELWGGTGDYPMVLAHHATATLRRCRVRDSKTLGVFIRKESQATLEDCEIARTGAANYGAATISGSTATLRRCRVLDSVSAGIKFSEGAKGAAEECECRNSTGSGFWIEGGSEVGIRHCKSHRNALRGISVSGDARATVDGCEVWPNGDNYPGVCVQDSVAEILGCHIHDNRAAGIEFNEQARGSVQDCECSGNQADGIEVNTKSNLAIRWSKSHQNGGDGVRFHGGAEGTLETCETFHNQVVGVRVVSSEVTLRNCRSHDNMGNAMVFCDGATVTLDNCEVWGQKDFPGIDVGASSAVLRACSVHDVASNGIVLRQGANGRFEQCDIRSNRVGGLVLVNAVAELVGCQLYRNGHAGLWLLENSRAQLKDCGLSENSPSGIDAQQGSTFEVTGCSVINNSGYGLMLGDGVKGTATSDCRLEPNGQGPALKPPSAFLDLGLPPGVPSAPERPVASAHGPLPQSPGPADEIFAELDSLIGLQAVKDTMRRIKARVALAKGDMSKLDGLHSLFLGGPGTGKTTVARMMGKILYRMGAIKADKVVAADGRKMVAPFLGQTANLTQQRINEAMGGVLLIDEAYALVKADNPQDFGQEAVDTLVPQMEDHRNELVVIAAGYPDRMDKFIRSNPGLKERFRYTFYFEDYKPAELMQIFRAMLRQRDVNIDDAAIALVEQEFAARYELRDEEFGNARMVRGFISDGLDNMALRLAGSEGGQANLTVTDIQPLCTSMPPKPRPVEEIMGELNALVGLRQVKEQVLQVMQTITYERRLTEEAHTSFAKPTLHSLFLGSPGTGKTTVARLMGEIYKNVGVLARGHTVAAERSDFVGQYIGQTAPKVKELVRKAMGGVLFVDEAYDLVLDQQDSFGREAIGALLTEMVSRGSQFVLIAAGYKNEMDRFLEANSGLLSRFPSEYRFHFEDYSPEELRQIFENLARKKGRICGPGVADRVLEEFSAAWRERTPTFGNGRAVNDYFHSVMARVAARVNKLPPGTPIDVLKTIVVSDLEGCLLDRGTPPRDPNRRIGFS